MLTRFFGNIVKPRTEVTDNWNDFIEVMLWEKTELSAPLATLTIHKNGLIHYLNLSSQTQLKLSMPEFQTLQNTLGKPNDIFKLWSFNLDKMLAKLAHFTSKSVTQRSTYPTLLSQKDTVNHEKILKDVLTAGGLDRLIASPTDLTQDIISLLKLAKRAEDDLYAFNPRGGGLAQAGMVRTR